MDNLTFFRALVCAAIGPAAAEHPEGLSRDIAARALQIARTVYQAERDADMPPLRRAEHVGGEDA